MFQSLTDRDRDMQIQIGLDTAGDGTNFVARSISGFNPGNQSVQVPCYMLRSTSCCGVILLWARPIYNCCSPGCSAESRCLAAFIHSIVDCQAFHRIAWRRLIVNAPGDVMQPYYPTFNDDAAGHFRFHQACSKAQHVHTLVTPGTVQLSVLWPLLQEH